MVSEADLAEKIAALVKRVLLLAFDDPDLRPQIRSLAQQVLEATEPSEPEPVEEPEATAAAEVPVEAAAAPAPVAEVPVAEESEPEEVADSPETESDEEFDFELEDELVERARSAPEVADSELPMIEARCRLKARGAHWFAQRQRMIAEGLDFQLEIEPKDREIIAEAKKLPDCFLWLNHPSGPMPADLRTVEQLAGCFETTADCIALLRLLISESVADEEALENALNLLAKSHSALRAAIGCVGYSRDNDQEKVHLWLKRTGYEHQIYIRRYMRTDDVADPGQWPELWESIQTLDTQVQERLQRQKRYTSGLQRIRYHSKKLADDSGMDHSHDWDVILETIDKLVADGTPPSNIELRELVLPLVDDIPDRPLPQNVQLVIREIDRYLASRSTPKPQDREIEPTEDVKLAASWLKGKALVLIGGDSRPHADEALKAAFGLSELDWIDTSKHESVATFETHVARPNVALVVLAIRWSSHSYGEVKEFCDRYGKPLVRLPGGYNPNQVAAQIVAQCSEQLG